MGKETYQSLESAVTQHLENLSVLLAFLLECEFALLIAISDVSNRGVGQRWGRMGAETHSFSFFPLRLFLPPFPLFFGILTERAQAMSLD